MIELYFLGAIVLATLCSLALTPLVRMLALKIDFVDHPGARKIHAQAMAYGGGIAVCLALVMATGCILFLRNTYAPELSILTHEDIGLSRLCILFGTALGALLLGLFDDRYRLSPVQKLSGQCVLAIIVVCSGIRLTAFVGDTLPMQIVSVCWIVLITNSFNLLDNMDGLCSGTVCISSALLGLVTQNAGQGNLTIMLGSLSGASMGFYFFNRTPAKIFLGDAGSLFCGFLMACGTILATYYEKGYPSHLAIGIPLLILAIPLYDTFSVICIRLREGRSILRGDTSHFSHRLVDLGMSRRTAVMTIHLACLAIGIPATVLGHLSAGQSLLIIAQGILVLTLIALLEHAGRVRSQDPARERFNASDRDPPL
jgi:UDP-GlcNAc:undecaprenyl-phosphate GlcNAc-1-phosphate transferase